MLNPNNDRLLSIIGAVMMTLLVSSIMTELLQEKNWIAFQKKMDSFAMKVKCLETGQRLPDLH